jgi:nitroreductase
MVRSFVERPLPRDVVDALLRATLSAPTAGNARGTAWVVLEGAEETSTYWDTATTADWRARSRRWPGLSRAPVVALSLASPDVYVARYAEPDKAAPSGMLGAGAGHWPVPYWFGDAAFAVMTLLLGATDAGIGACFLGNFRAEETLLAAVGVPAGWRLFGAVALGYPDGTDHRSASLARPAPPVATRIHFGTW